MLSRARDAKLNAVRELSPIADVSRDDDIERLEGALLKKTRGILREFLNLRFTCVEKK